MPDWKLRTTAPELERRYRDEGLWTRRTFGQEFEEGLPAVVDAEFRIWSETRPWRGTIGEVAERARRVAATLAKLGIGPGDVVAFQLTNCMEAAAVYWGVTLSGAVVVPVVHFYGSKELAFILRESGARMLVTIDRFGRRDFLETLDVATADAPSLEHIFVVGESTDLPGRARPFVDLLEGDRVTGPVPVDPTSVAILAYTSGTTSNPKGVLHTHESLLAELIGGDKEMEKFKSDVDTDNRPAYVGAPVGHFIGLLSGLLGPIRRGRPIHLADSWNPSRALAAMREANLVFPGGATYFLTSLLDLPEWQPSDVAYMRRAGLGGAPVPRAVADRATALGIEIMRSYGSTEHPSISGASFAEPREKRISTDGRAMPGNEMRIVDENGRDLGPGEAGEILSRGPELMAGYTDAALTASAIDGDGWYHTGDVGIIDEDGWLTITDRVRDIIIRGGENISAAEIEELLLRMPGVAEVAVVAAPDVRMGEHACAFIRVLPGSAEPTLDEVRTHMSAAGLGRQKWPEELRFVDDFPRTPSSKVKKFELRDRVRREAAG